MIILWLFTKGFLWELPFHLNIPSEYFRSLVNCQGFSLCIYRFDVLCPSFGCTASGPRQASWGLYRWLLSWASPERLSCLRMSSSSFQGMIFAEGIRSTAVWFYGHFPSLSLWGFLRKHSWKRFFSPPRYSLTCCPPTLESHHIPLVMDVPHLGWAWGWGRLGQSTGDWGIWAESLLWTVIRPWSSQGLPINSCDFSLL